MIYKREDYENDPVHYCGNCLSLNIKELSSSNLYVCGECGNVHINETDINTWTELYNKEYGKYFLSSEETEVSE